MKRITAIKIFLKLYIYRLNHGISHPAGDMVNMLSPVPPEPAEEYKTKWKLNLALFIITLCTTTLFAPTSGETVTDALLGSLPYSLTLMTILSVHEFGHYFAARKFGVRATLPFFIPFPSIIGTMGAVIKTKSPIPHTRALFYIGVMGPIPGFIVSLAAVIVGVAISSVQYIPINESPVLQLGNSILFSGIVYIFHGSMPPGQDLFLHPVAWAGWIGFFITSLNLMPIGQLDGGHVLYALIGIKQRYAGWAALAILVVLTFIWPGWGLWIVITFLILMVAHPPINRTEPLTIGEKAAGWFCMAILILTFIPIPVQLI